jgi:GNAT superfamily N-acetyltransferase
MAPGERIRPLRREELDVVLDWAGAEGWEPGRGDADAFWAADPDAFFGLEREGELIGSISTVSYAGAFGFVGLFIVRPELRGGGIGRRLWAAALDALRDRLDPGAPVGLDGVFERQAY